MELVNVKQKNLQYPETISLASGRTIRQAAGFCSNGTWFSSLAPSLLAHLCPLPLPQATLFLKPKIRTCGLVSMMSDELVHAHQSHLSRDFHHT